MTLAVKVATYAAAAVVGAGLAGTVVTYAATTTPATPSVHALCTRTDTSTGWTENCVNITPAPTDTLAPTDTPSPAPTSTPAPTATPTPTATPSPTPSTWPDATNTGPTGTLRIITGNYTIPANQTLSNVEITGSAIMNAGAKLINSKIDCADENDWCLALDGSNTVASVEIGSQSNGSPIAVGVWGAGNVITKTNIHNTSDGLRVDNGLTMTDSWVHGLTVNSVVHSDGAQGTRLNPAPIVFQHNTIEGGTNDALFMDSFGGPLTITGNQLLSVSAPGELSSHAIAVNHAPAGTTVTITGNVVSKAWEAGAISIGYTGPVTESGNTYPDGTPVS